MEQEVIHVGVKIEITQMCTQKEMEQAKVICNSCVREWTGEDQFQIEMPIQENGQVLLENHHRYHLLFYATDGLFSCVAQVVERFRSENRCLALMELKSGLRRVQRREFYRLDKLMDVLWRPITAEESQMSTAELVENDSEQENVSVYKNAVAVDLSGGGMRLILECKLDWNQLILVGLLIKGNEQPLFLTGQVIYSAPVQKDQRQFENRIRFIRLQEEEKEQLIRAIFEEDRKMRQIEKS